MHFISHLLILITPASILNIHIIAKKPPWNSKLPRKMSKIYTIEMHYPLSTNVCVYLKLTESEQMKIKKGFWIWRPINMVLSRLSTQKKHLNNGQMQPHAGLTIRLLCIGLISQLEKQRSFLGKPSS